MACIEHSAGNSNREIAQRLGRNASTIGRELKRNRPLRRIYGLDAYSRAKQANDMAVARRTRTRSERVRLKGLWIQRLVHEQIEAGWSPQIVAGRLLIEHGVMLSHEAIYRWIYKIERELIKYLTRQGRKYRRNAKRRSRSRLEPAAPKLSIEKRPLAANERREFGHWEVDTVVSKQSKACLLVLCERVSRFFFVVKLPSCTVEEASRTVIDCLRPLGAEWLKSLTCDNGPENWGHEALTTALGIPVYFCHPYTSSERGTVENRNGVLRRYLPKKTDFEKVSDAELNRVWQLLLHRPMRCLDYFTPYEVFHETFESKMKLAA